MTTLGIALIVIGVALVCGGLILWPRAPQREDEDQADGTMADILQRLNESSDADPLEIDNGLALSAGCSSLRGLGPSRAGPASTSWF